MAVARAEAPRAPQPPQGRYGRSPDARADRKLKIAGAVLGAVALAVIAWFGYHSLADQSVAGEIIKYKRVSAAEIQIHLEVRKGADTTGSCTVRALDVNHEEVGRKDVRFEGKKTRIDEIVDLRTTGEATATELVGCSNG